MKRFLAALALTALSSGALAESLPSDALEKGKSHLRNMESNRTAYTVTYNVSAESGRLEAEKTVTRDKFDFSEVLLEKKNTTSNTLFADDIYRIDGRCFEMEDDGVSSCAYKMPRIESGFRHNLNVCEGRITGRNPDRIKSTIQYRGTAVIAGRTCDMIHIDHDGLWYTYCLDTETSAPLSLKYEGFVAQATRFSPMASRINLPKSVRAELEKSSR